MNKNKKALSPVITTILLIMLAIVLAVIILLWARGFVKESLGKFDEPIDRACEKVNLQVAVSGSELSIINLGDVPIYKMGIRLSGAGTSQIFELNEMNFLVGSSTTISDPRLNEGTVDKIVPILLGSTSSGEVKQYNCPKANWITPE